MKFSKSKKLISMITVLLMILSCVFSPALVWIKDTVYAEEINDAISINKTYLKIGDTITVSNPKGYALKFYVNNEEIPEDPFILKQDYYESWIKVEAYDGLDVVSDDSVYFSKLPVLYINTSDGLDITSKDEYKNADLYIQNNDNIAKQIYAGAIQIKGRGNSTWTLPKKPYRIKLDKKTDLFGMGSNKNWVLLANYIDESLLRNTTAFQVADQSGLTDVKSVWADVVLNGEYIGNYQLCEQIRIDEGRVDIFDWEGEAKDIASAVAKKEKKKGNVIDKDVLEDFLTSDFSWVTSGAFTFNEVQYKVSDYYDAEDDISGGYLFELSNEYDELSKFTTDNGLKVMIKSPEYLYTNADMMDYVQKYWECFENAYRSEDGYTDSKEGKKHYSEYADIDSMVSYWLVMEIMGNNDAVYKSRYAYIDLNGKIVYGPAWDFDWGCGSLVVGTSATGWKVSKSSNAQAFYKEFLDDPLFIVKATEKYWKIRQFLEELIKSDGIIDTEYLYLKESGNADATRWDRSVKWPDKARGFETDVDMFKAYLVRRITWLDEQFSSDSSLLSSTYTESSAAPYERVDSQLLIEVLNSSVDSFTNQAPADAAIKTGKDAIINVSVTDTNTVSLNVYVNGLIYGTVPVSDGQASFVVANDRLDSEIGKKNVVSLIGKNDSSTTTYRNFVTIMQSDEVMESDEAVVLSDSSITVTEGESFTLSAEVLPEETANKTVIWESMDPSIATVDAEGHVTTVYFGQTTITARTIDGKAAASCDVVITPLPRYDVIIETTGEGSVTASLAKAKAGETVTLSVVPEDGYKLVSLLVVDKNGNNVYVDSDNRLTMPEADVTVNAIFVPNSPTVTVDFGAGHEYFVSEHFYEGLSGCNCTVLSVTDSQVVVQFADAMYIGSEISMINDFLVNRLDNDVDAFDGELRSAFRVGTSSSDYSSLAEYEAMCTEMELQYVTGNEVFYAYWYAPISEVSLTIEAPGDKTPVSKVRIGDSDFYRSDPQPVLTVSEGVCLNSTTPPSWVTSDHSDIFEGTIREGETYHFHASVQVDFGYYLTENVQYALDGGMIISANDGDIYGTVTATRMTEPVINGHALLLSSEIGVQFKVTVPEDFDVTGSKMEFVVSDGKTATMKVKSATKIEGENAYWFTCYINALELADTITATFKYGTDKEITGTYSAMTYIDVARTIYPEKEKLLNLVASIQDYGHYMQGSGWTDGLTHEPIDAYTDLDDDSIEAVKSGVSEMHIVKELRDSGVSEVLFALRLNEKTVINIYALPDEGMTITSSTAKAKGTQTIGGKEYYQFDTDKISAENLGTAYTITLSTENGTATINVSAMSYVYAVLNSESFTVEKKKAMAAYYGYYTKAIAYAEQ